MDIDSYIIIMFNSMPSYQKQPIETILDNQEVQTSMTKVTKFVSGLVNGVEVEAGWCSYYYKKYWHWWGTQTYLNHCYLEDINMASAIGGVGAGVSGTAVCSYFTGGLCGIGFGVISGIIGLSGQYAIYLSNQCGQAGVYYNETWGNKAKWYQSTC
jgi:hypothetical protein